MTAKLHTGSRHQHHVMPPSVPLIRTKVPSFDAETKGIGSELGQNRTMASETAHAAAREIGSALKRLSVYNQEADLKLLMLRSETVALELSGEEPSSTRLSVPSAV